MNKKLNMDEMLPVSWLWPPFLSLELIFDWFLISGDIRRSFIEHFFRCLCCGAQKCLAEAGTGDGRRFTRAIN